MIALLCLGLTSPPNLTFAASLAPGPNSYYVGNRAPLKQNALYKLPIGAIKPKGWLRVQLVNEANGETGHLEEISPWLNKTNNAWLSSTGQGEHGWEETPYWLKGFGDLGYVLDDPRVISHAKVWLDGVLSGQREDGYFGPRSNLVANKGKPDMWPNMVMLFALQSYYEWRHDPRVLSAMTRYFKWQEGLPESEFYLSYWEKHRGGDNLESVYWLYNRTGDKFLLDLARKIHRRTADWMSGVPDWHGVNFAQAFREPEEYAELEPSSPGVKSTEADYELMRKLYGQVPGGMYGADENARPGIHDPRQGTETCAMVEMMLSDELLLKADGDPKWADRCEDVAFNNLPAAQTSDEEALHYLTAPNLVDIDDRSKAPGFQNGGPMLLFNPYDHRCCQHNVSHGWPYFAEHLWMATSANGLAATVFAPSQVTAQVGDGQTVRVEEQTAYPFRDEIRFRFHMSSPARFSFSARMPGWLKGGSATVGGTSYGLTEGPGFATFDRTWRDGDLLVLKLPMRLELKRWEQNGNAISVDRGPLSYALRIGERKVKSLGTKDFPATESFPAWEVHPTTSWNFGLVPDLSRFKVKEKSFDASRQPFDLTNIPLEIEAPARQIPEWSEDYTGLVAQLQQSPAFSSDPETTVVLIPMACERLRISEFPTVSDSPSAHHWKGTPKANPPIPASSSHTFEGDSTDALSTGFTPSSSNDQAVPRFTWWDRKGTEEWVEYDFPNARQVQGVEVYWFDDRSTGGGCRTPQGWKLQGFSRGLWKDLSEFSEEGTQRDRFNKRSIKPTVVEKLRIVARLQPGYSAGILQWGLR